MSYKILQGNILRKKNHCSHKNLSRFVEKIIKLKNHALMITMKIMKNSVLVFASPNALEGGVHRVSARQILRAAKDPAFHETL